MKLLPAMGLDKILQGQTGARLWEADQVWTGRGVITGGSQWKEPHEPRNREAKAIFGRHIQV